MLRNVFTKDLWDRRRATMWWVIGIVMMMAWIIAVYPIIRDSDAMSQFLTDFPPELLALFGMDPDTFLTAAGFFQAQLFSFIGPIVIVGFAVSAGVAVTAREERAKTMDLLLSVPVSRSSIVLQKAASLAVLALVIVATMAACLVVANPVVGLDLPIEGVIAVTSGLWLLGLVFAGVAMVIGAFTGSPTIAGGIAATLAIVAWFVNAFASIFTWLEIPAKVSPFTWYLHGLPLINGFSSGHLWLVVATLVALAGTVILFKGRNIGFERSFLPSVRRRTETVKRTRPRATALLGSVYGKSLWDRRVTVWLWAAGISTMSLLTFAAWPSLARDAQALQSLVDSFPKEILAMFGLTDPTALATPEGFVSSRTYGSVGPIVMIVFAITAMASLIAKEESTGIMDLVLSNPQRRREVFQSKSTAAWTLMSLIALFLFAVAAIGNAVWNTGFSLYHMVGANLGLALLGLCFWGIAVAVWAVRGGSGAAVGVTAAIAVGMYFLNGLGAIVDALGPFRYLSPFYWYLGDVVPLSKGITFGYAALAAVALAGTAFAASRFTHRDLAV
jgi:ABC-2 type transport system permease protein